MVSQYLFDIKPLILKCVILNKKSQIKVVVLKKEKFRRRTKGEVKKTIA